MTYLRFKKYNVIKNLQQLKNLPYLVTAYFVFLCSYLTKLEHYECEPFRFEIKVEEYSGVNCAGSVETALHLKRVTTGPGKSWNLGRPYSRPE